MGRVSYVNGQTDAHLHIKIMNPVKEIEENIPELSEIKDTSSNIEYVSSKNFDNRLKTIATKNLNKYKRALTWVSLGSYFKPCIIEYCLDDGSMAINKDKYKLIRQYVMSEEHHK